MLLVFFGGTPDTYHTAGLERGTATSSSTTPGTTSPPSVVADTIMRTIELGVTITDAAADEK
ncbi:MAG: hypothetical protein ACRDT5_15215, partial [Mycobacterium sp.]